MASHQLSRKAQYHAYRLISELREEMHVPFSLVLRYLAYCATHIALANDPAELQRLRQMQGNWHNWTDYPRGVSPENLLRWIKGKSVSRSAFHIFCKVIERCSNHPFHPDQVAAIDPPPFIDIYSEFTALSLNLQRLSLKPHAILPALRDTPLKLHKWSKEYAGIPRLIHPSALTFSFSSSPYYQGLLQLEVQASVDGHHRIPCGHVIINPDLRLAVLISDERPYVYRGAEMKAGNKKVRSIKLHGTATIPNIVLPVIKNCFEPSLFEVQAWLCGLDLIRFQLAYERTTGQEGDRLSSALAQTHLEQALLRHGFEEPRLHVLNRDDYGEPIAVYLSGATLSKRHQLVS